MGLYRIAVFIFLLPHVVQMTEISPGFKIRITSRGMELCKKMSIPILIDYSDRLDTIAKDSHDLIVCSLVKYETQKFVEQELGGITMPEMHGKKGNLQYSITE